MKKNLKAKIVASSVVGLIVLFLLGILFEPSTTIFILIMIVIVLSAIMVIFLLGYLWFAIYSELKENDDKEDRIYNFLRKIYE